MEKYSDLYKRHLENLNSLERSIMDSVVIAIKTISVKPLEIGNMVYYYVEDNGVELPAYCYRCDYDKAILKNEEPVFLPIYDIQGLGEYGWSNFDECCKIFDVIRYTLFNK